jgi:hypothetical protein
MILDSYLQVDSEHAYTGAAVSQRSVDLGNVTPKRVVGVGEELGFGIFVDVAADSTTVKLEVIQTTDEALTAGIIVLAEQTRLAADLPAGGKIFMPLPPQAPAAGALRYVGIRATPAGGNATVTLSAFLMPRALFESTPVSYADAITIG